MRISNVTDAVNAARYLHERKVLCEKCCLNEATLVNQYVVVCHTCRPKHGEYTERKVESVFDQELCRALRAYTQAIGGPVPGEAWQGKEQET